MKDKHDSFYATDIKAISFCGNIIAYQLTGSSYKVPFAVPPIMGPHDFNNCDVCQKNLASFTTSLTERFNGYDSTNPFPNCCEWHSNLDKLPEFNREDYLNVPIMVAQKIVYTNQQIVNHHNSEDWFTKITHYIKWMVSSFGEVPQGCGEPLFFKFYIDCVIDLLLRFKSISASKKVAIQNFLQSFTSPEKKTPTYLNILVSTYEKWFKAFPFEISYLSHLKADYQRQIPILNGKPEINIYSGDEMVKMHDKESLIKELIIITNSLLSKINLLDLYEKGLITDSDQLKLELILSSRKLKLNNGYANKSRDSEQRYIRILKEWLKDEKQFIHEITPLLTKPPDMVSAPASVKLKVNQIALIHVYQSKQITRENAGFIAGGYGFIAPNSGEGLFQDYILYCSPANRRGKPSPCTPKKLKNKIALFTSLLPHLENNARQRALDELTILQTHLEAEY